MNQKVASFKIFFCFFMGACFMQNSACAQQYDCNFKPPVITIDFGNSSNQKDVDLSSLTNYTKIDEDCPGDGNYTFATHTSNCFWGNWNTLTEDHTPGDIDGRMMIINAAEEPGTFFMNYISGLKQGTTYEFSVWLLNICWGSRGCDPDPPQIDISISSGANIIAEFGTGQLLPSPVPVWKKYYGTFTVPPGANVIVIKMDNTVHGGCGSDFVVDDILLKECMELKPPVVASPKNSTG